MRRLQVEAVYFQSFEETVVRKDWAPKPQRQVARPSLFDPCFFVLRYWKHWCTLECMLFQSWVGSWNILQLPFN